MIFKIKWAAFSILLTLSLTACPSGGSTSSTDGTELFAIATTALTPAVNDVAYNAALTTKNGTAPITFAWQTGYTPPAWLNLSTNGVLSGTPNATGSHQLLIQATESSANPNMTTRTLTLDVLARPSITSTVFMPSVIGQTYNDQLTHDAVSPLNPTFQLATGSTLPTGISMDTTGTLTGTPTVTGLFPVVVELLVGGEVVDTTNLDFVVYPSIPFTYVEDANESPTPNNDAGSATELGPVTPTTPIEQTAPLTVNSDLNIANPDPDDYFRFITNSVGTITVEVFFKALVGEIDIYLWHYDGSTHQVAVVASSTGYQTDGEKLVLYNAPLSFPGTGYYYLQVNAPNDPPAMLWNRNEYTFRVSFNDLTITTEQLEADSSAGSSIDVQVNATNQGSATTSATWTLVNGTLPTGVTFTSDGHFTGTPTEFGLYDFTVSVEENGGHVERDIRVRFFDSANGDYWQVSGNRLKYDIAGNHSEWVTYGEAMVVAPHPDYPTEGAIYALGGEDSTTIDKVRVFHTDRSGIPVDKHFKFEEITPSLTSARRFFGAAFLQHSYGGYIYVVGGEVGVSSGVHSAGDFWYGVQRLQVADGSGNALAHPLTSTWESVANLPQMEGSLNINGWAEFGLVASDETNDADDRIYLVGGRYQREDNVGSGTFTKLFHDKVLMFEAPTTASGFGAWHVKSDSAAYTPRRFPVVAMVNDRIYIVGGREGTAGQGGTGGNMIDSVEMYAPDPVGTNAATATTPASNFPTLTEGTYASMFGVIGGDLYVWCGWDSGFIGTRYLHKFTPNATGTGGTMTRLTDADWGTGLGGSVAYDGKLWIIGGIGHGAYSEPKNLVYHP